ncbi:Serine/threonine-protein kinase PAK 5 [Gnomoniopsis sp. IMI 355080]|nr:Serine/threonine-protein kinase PAK 5 [Gnomoniopsis sp. IMI 355080]
MATLQVGAADLSATKKKAMEDAEKMQRSIIRDCAENGRQPPPYALSELIGKGSFGRVYKAKASDTGQLVAIKIISIEEGDSLAPGAADTFKDILKEVNTLKKLGDSGAKNINTVIETLLVGPSMWIVTEHCAGGSVSTLMRPSGRGLPEKWVVPILREVAQALFWVHKEGIIHRDIKCANVLVTEAGGVQLCDFGVAGIIETKFDKRSTVTGTLNWMAPELFDMSVSYGTEVDIWAFGSLAFEAATGLPPNAKNMARIDIPQFGSYLKQHCPRLEGDQYSGNLKDLVAFCMTEDPRNRPSISQVQRHAYIWRTEQQYPTVSLKMLVNAYRLWEVQGGNRMSLFNAGGAQRRSVGNEAAAPAPDDGWDFNTMTEDFNLPCLGDKEAKAVYDAYGPRVSMMPPPPRESSRRRRPPNMPKLKGPLEKAFDPNTITDYEENSRLFYGRPMPTSAPEMGTEREQTSTEQPRESLIDLDFSLDGDRLSRFADMDGETIKGSQVPNRQTIRESGLIDLDASLDGDRLSRFADMDTVRASRASIRPLGRSQTTLDRRRTQDWTFAGADVDGNSQESPEKPQNENGRQRESQLFRSQSTMDHRRTQDWTFASAAPQTSPQNRPPDIGRSQSSLESRRTQEWTFASAASANAHLGGEWFQSNEEDDYMALDSLPQGISNHHPNDSMAVTHHHDDSLAVVLPPRAATSLEVSRFSSSSLIDLDMSLTDSTGEPLRPSTAEPDSAMSESWGAPFRMPHQRSFGPSSDGSLPSSSREPSLYIPSDDMIPNGNREPSLYIPDGPIPRSIREPSLYISDETIPRSTREPSLYVADTSISPSGSLSASYTGDDFSLRAPVPSTPTSDAVMTPPSDFDEDAPRRGGGYVSITVEGEDAPMPALPYMPGPPTVNVLQGTATSEEVREELARMVRSLHEHLQYTGSVMRTLPVRSGQQVDQTTTEVAS